MKNLVYDPTGDYLNPRIAMIAKSGSGKSWVVRDILYYMRDIPCGVIIAPTDRMTKFYDTIFPSLFIYHEFEENIIPRLLARQRRILDKNVKRVRDGKKPIDPRVVLIMDDCMSSKHLWLKDPNILTVFNEGRHYQITFILTMQYSLGIQPELRSNFDYIFLLGEDFITNKKKLYEHYAGMFPTRDLFYQVFESLTDNYGCMVINNRLRSSDVYKKIFHYKAKKREGFTVGGTDFKNYHEENFDKNHDRKVPIIDINSLLIKRRNRANVVIYKGKG